ncbi:MAG: enoyl-CoA hydratase [Acidobacteria bacterium]|nr:enoyl-CoA hydratase [Acidobacteriota bacterium]|tara:strand:- start:46 stop:828 length:783 start_codon:yes stop_codon:yes gene_type:complete
MSDERILISREGAVATVTVNRPKVLNALDAETVSALADAFSALKADASVRVVVLTGAGDRAFIAGADIRELARLTPSTARGLADRGHQLCNEMEQLGKPVIASINGFALGGGCELAMACTLRLAARSAKLGQPEIGLGLMPGYGGTQRLPRLVGRGRALELMLTGASIDATEAHRIGLVNRVVDDEALADETTALAATLAEQAPVAVRLILEAVYYGVDMSMAEASRFECSTFSLAFDTEDVREGTIAFLEKRAPQFTGH